MVLVDSSVWVDYFRGHAGRETELLEQLLEHRLVLTGDLVLAEVLRGFRRDADYRKARRALSRLEFRGLVGLEVALLAAQNNRKLRKKGITVRKTIDLLIASFCVHQGYELLHADRDFDAMAPHIGLQTL